MISSTRLQTGQAVGDEDQRAALGDLQQVGGEGVGGRRVEVLGRLVQHQDAEVGQQGPGHGHPLALAARDAGTVPADLGGQPPREPVQPAGQPHPAEDVGACRRRAGVASADPQVLGDGGVEEVGVLADQADDGAQSVAGQAVDGVPPRVSDPACHGRNRRSTAASVDLPAPLGPTTATRRPGASDEVHAPKCRTGRARVPGPHRTGLQVGRGRRGPVRATSGSRTGTGASSHVEDPGRGLAHPLQGLGGDGKTDHQLEGGQGDQGDDGQLGPVEPTGGDRRDADQRGIPSRPGRPAGWSGPGPIPAVPAEAAAMAVSSASCPADGPELGVGGTEGHQLGGALGEVHHGRGQIAAGLWRTAPPSCGPGPVSQGTTVAASSRATARIIAGGRQHPPQRGPRSTSPPARRWRTAG